MPLILFSTVLAVVPNSYDEGKEIQSINTGKYKKGIRKGEDKSALKYMNMQKEIH